MDDGILDIALLPAWSPSSVKAALTAALSRATRLQAGIAFWTIDSALPGPDLVRALHDQHGFVCVDLGALEPSLIAQHPAPRVAALQEVAEEVSPLLGRLDVGARAELFGRREVRVKRPTVAASVQLPRTVAALRSQDEHPLVNMRVLVPATA